MTRGGTLTIRLVRSPIGYQRRQKATVRSLGFTRMHQVRTLPDNEAVRGMVRAISHLVRIDATNDERTSR
ncbi:MAG: 50S ribosomal protein L30 [Acidobacteriota bacterium]